MRPPFIELPLQQKEHTCCRNVSCERQVAADKAVQNVKLPVRYQCLGRWIEKHVLKGDSYFLSLFLLAKLASLKISHDKNESLFFQIRKPKPGYPKLFWWFCEKNQSKGDFRQFFWRTIVFLATILRWLSSYALNTQKTPWICLFPGFVLSHQLKFWEPLDLKAIQKYGEHIP